MIRRRHNTKIFFILFQAIAVAIICLGSLINFHQYKIWGKPLIPTFIGYKRDVEKYSKALTFSKFSRSNQFTQHHFAGNDGFLPSGAFQPGFETCTLLVFSFPQDLPVAAWKCSCGPRAPPAV